MSTQITMKKLAELAGVSRGTVDKVLNGRPGVKAETKKKVLEIAKALHYQPNILGKALVSRESVKIGIILTPEYNPFVLEMLEGIRRAEREYTVFNLEISVRMLTALEPAEQISILNELKMNGVQGIALFPIDDDRVRQLVNTFIKEGIAVITFNSRAEGINSLCFVGQNHIKGGAAAAGLLQKLLPMGGEIGVIISSHSLSCHEDRLSGFQDRIQRKNSGLTVIGIKENQDQEDRAFELTLEYCSRYPNLSGIYITSGGVMGCARALAITGKSPRVKLVCHDVTPEAKKLLADGTLDFAIDQGPQTQGYQLVKVLFEYLVKKQQPEPWIEIPIGIITEDLL